MNETNTTESFQDRCERECREVALANIDAAQRSERLYGIFLAVAFVAAAVLVAIAAILAPAPAIAKPYCPVLCW